LLFTIERPVVVVVSIVEIGAVPANVIVDIEASEKLTIAGVEVTTPDAVVVAVFVLVIVKEGAVLVSTELPAAILLGVLVLAR
jgi:hypothetical protein